MERGWLAEGDAVLDPFAGVALGAADALAFGLNWTGNELEAHFVDMGRGCECTGIGKEDWIRCFGRWKRFAHKDGRHWCPRCLAEAERVVEPRPPALPGMGPPPTASYERNSGKIPHTEPHHYIGNLELFAKHARNGARATLLQGDSRHLLDVLGGARAAACVSSPPYAGNYKSDYTHERRDERRLGIGFKGRGRGCFRGSENYSDDPANLGNLPAGNLEETIRMPEILPNAKPEIVKRFFDKVKKTANCWQWLGSNNGKGYGQLWLNGKHQLAHRISWELHYGEIPDGMLVCHKCDNPGCVRPDHLFIGTISDNWNDCLEKERAWIFTNPEKQVRGERHGRAKLTDAEVEEIRSLHAGGVSCTELGERYGVTRQHINGIILGKYRSSTGNMREGDFAAVVSSPAYAGGCAHTGGDDPKPEHVEGGELRFVEYGRSAGQLAAMPEGEFEAQAVKPKLATQGSRGIISNQKEVISCQTVKTVESKFQGEAAGVNHVAESMSVKPSKGVKNLKDSGLKLQQPDVTSQPQNVGGQVIPTGMVEMRNGEDMLGMSSAKRPLRGMDTSVSNVDQQIICKSIIKKTRRKREESGTTTSPILRPCVPNATLPCIDPLQSRLPVQYVARNTKQDHQELVVQKNAGGNQAVAPNENTMQKEFPDNFWAAARQIVEQCWLALAPGGVAIFVLKDFIRNKQRIPFCDQWRRMCEACGFETVEWIRAWLVEDQGAQWTLGGILVKNRVERKSFFRRLHEKKYPELSIDFEVVLVMRKAEGI